MFRREASMNEAIDILTSLGIPGEKIEHYYIDDEDDVICYYVELKDIRSYCPECGCVHMRIKGYYDSKIRHSIFTNKQVYVFIRNRRYVCLGCGKTFKQKFPLAEKGSTISNKTKLEIVEDLKTKKTIIQIAKERNVSSTTVRKLLDEAVRYQPQLSFPEVICIDEFCYKHSATKEGKYPAVISDPFSGDIIDIVYSRWKSVLFDYFNKVKYQDRLRVKYFVSDMNETYRQVKKAFFRDATHIIDRFHLIKAFNEAITRIRTRILKQEIYYKDDEYRFLKKNWKIFLMNRDNAEKKYYEDHNGIKKPLTYKIDTCLQKYRELSYAYWTKQEFLRETKKLLMYNAAEKIVNFYTKKLVDNQLEEMREIGKTFTNWAIEIINGLVRNPYQRRLTNAIAESNNNYIQTLIDASYGLPVFERMRKRVLYINRNRKNQKD